MKPGIRERPIISVMIRVNSVREAKQPSAGAVISFFGTNLSVEKPL